jgi:hypothetical protein
MLRMKKKQLSETDIGKLSKMLFQTKRLCHMLDAQIGHWENGERTLWPVDPYRICTPGKRVVFALGDYKHMQPDVQRFMDWAGLEYWKACIKPS